MNYVLLRGPRTDEDGNKIPVSIMLLKKNETDLSNHSFLRSTDTYEEWVPSNELHLYKGINHERETTIV